MPEGRPSLLGDDQWPGDPAEDPLNVGLEEAPEDQTGEPEAPEPQAPEAATAPTEQPAEGDEPATEGEPAPAVTEPLLAGRFKTVEDLEAGWRESDAFARRAAGRANQAETASRQAAAELAAMREQIKVLQPLIDAQQRPQIDPAMLEQAGIDPSQLGLVQQLIDHQVESRLGPVQQQIEAEATARTAEQADRARLEAISAFRAAHPDSDQHETPMVDLLDDLGVLEQPRQRPDGTWYHPGPKDAGWYEVAFEAVQRPALARVLRGNPTLSETDDGMEVARAQAAQLEALAARTAQPQGAPAPTAPAPPGSAAVLTGPANTPAGAEQRAKDPIDEIVEEDRNLARSPFVGGSF